MTFNAQWLVHTPEETDLDPWGARFTLNEHFERVAGVIEVIEPDVIALIEVTSEDATRHLVRILEEKGLDGYEAYHVENQDTHTGQDVAFISRIAPDIIGGASIRNFYSHEPGEKWREAYTYRDRGTERHKTTSVSKNAVVYLTVNEHKLGLLGVHLIARPDHYRRNRKREAQARVLQRILRDEVVKRGYAPIVLGDINDYDGDVEGRSGIKPKTKVLRLLKDYDPVPGDELINASTFIRRKFDRYSSHWDRNNDGVPNEGDQMTLIDHALLHRSLAPLVRRVFIDHGHGSQTSDHWPIVVDLEIP